MKLHILAALLFSVAWVFARIWPFTTDTLGLSWRRWRVWRRSHGSMDSACSWGVPRRQCTSSRTGCGGDGCAVKTIALFAILTLVIVQDDLLTIGHGLRKPVQPMATGTDDVELALAQETSLDPSGPLWLKDCDARAGPQGTVQGRRLRRFAAWAMRGWRVGKGWVNSYGMAT